MGVPGFYRWAVRHVRGVRQAGCKPPYEFDHVYLDFNGVVHGCIDAWGGQEDEAVLFKMITDHLEVLIALTNPRMMLYVALDGVAPRAKLNQQRSRRFRAGQERDANANTIEGVCAHFDRNAVTPGTDFMVRLSQHLKLWASANAKCDQLLGVTVVISDDRDPGEGEHKIMEVIRHHPEHTHCLVSSDADLVFLGLVCPAQHVYLLRASNKARDKVVATPSDGKEATEQQEEKEGPQLEESYELLGIRAVREYLAQRFPGSDAKRVGIDFVAMCCLAGNDFLPHIPAVDIYQGGIDSLMAAYQELDPVENGYMVTEDLSLNLPRWQALLHKLAPAEAEVILESEGLALTEWKKKNWRPKPPGAAWDGLSILVTYAPARIAEAEVREAMSKQGCEVDKVYSLKSNQGARGPSSWLVRFSTPEAAVKTLISQRRIRGSLVQVTWTDPDQCNLAESDVAKMEFSRVDWKSAVDAAVTDCMEFWLASENLRTDAFLRRHVRGRADRFVPVAVFTKFNRMQILCQDVAEIARVCRASQLLEVQGDGEEALVRGKEDFSLAHGETAEQAGLQVQAIGLMRDGDFAGAVGMLKYSYYAKYAGPTADGPPASDREATEDHRSRAFLTGIEWVVRYYVKGCASWSWFYPAHFPPLCTSLAAAAGRPLDVPPLREPFAPEMQLLSVLPTQSVALLPARLRHLLMPGSPLEEFYPKEFEVHLKDGDREWQAILLIPFVDEAKMRRALAEIGFDDFTAFEKATAFRGWEVRPPSFAMDPCRRLARIAKMVCCGVEEPKQVKASSWVFSAKAELDVSQIPAERQFSRPEEVAVTASAVQADAKQGGRGKGKGKGGGKGKGKRRNK